MSIHRDIMDTLGARSHLDALGETVRYTAIASQVVSDIAAVAHSEFQGEVEEGEREQRRCYRRFTIDGSSEGIARPQHNDTIEFEDEKYRVDRIERSGSSTHTVLTWREYSLEKTRVGQRGHY